MREHSSKWLIPTSTLEATESQREMSKRVLVKDELAPSLSLIGGMDVSNNLFDPLQMIYAAVVLLSYPTLAVIETASHAEQQVFPYIPGLLGFREAPALIKAFAKLSTCPDLILVDGHGISHPRGLGIASHIGVLLDIPTIGVAKSILVGKPEGILGEEVGSRTSLIWKKKEIGVLLRSKKRCAPLIVSAGHKISLETAVKIVLECCKGYRLPEPTRYAHKAANACRLGGVFDSSNRF